MMEGNSSVAAVAEALHRYLRGGRVPQGATTSVAPPSSASADAIRQGSLENVLAVASDAYKENARITAVLDDKAQKAAQTAGIFLGAGFALMKPGGDNVSKYVGELGLAMMAVAVALLMSTVILTLIANWIRRIPVPLNPARVYEMTMLLVGLPDNELTTPRHIGHLNDIAGLWLEILAKQHKANRLKARFVRIAQLFLALAMVVVGFLLILVLQRARIL